MITDKYYCRDCGKPLHSRTCFGCNGSGEVGHLLWKKTCQICKGSGKQYYCIDEHSHILGHTPTLKPKKLILNQDFRTRKSSPLPQIKPREKPLISELGTGRPLSGLHLGTSRPLSSNYRTSNPSFLMKDRPFSTPISKIERQRGGPVGGPMHIPPHPHWENHIETVPVHSWTMDPFTGQPKYSTTFQTQLKPRLVMK